MVRVLAEDRFLGGSHFRHTVMIAPDERPYSRVFEEHYRSAPRHMVSTRERPALERGIGLRAIPTLVLVWWHDVSRDREAGGAMISRADAMARAVIECAADAIVAFGTDRTVMLWNPAAERMFGWAAAEVAGLEPPIIPEELKAEHNAVLERVRGGGQISFATRRIRKDRTVIDLRIDTSALTNAAGEVTGWVNVCHQTGEDDVARHYMAERARVVRRLGDVVADMNAQRDLESVLDRIAASLRELTSADAGGFVIIEEDTLRLVSTAGLPPRLRGRTASLPASLVGELMRSGKTVMMATGESGGFDDLIWSALPGLHTIALSLSHVGESRTARCTRCTAGASSATSSWNCWSCWPGTQAWR
jgi:PAS domain S-box-containing protein